jgi:hypothetical protein
MVEKCGKMSLRIENVMGSTKLIYFKCDKCYKDKCSYGVYNAGTKEI